jgi:hypothetical protein
METGSSSRSLHRTFERELQLDHMLGTNRDRKASSYSACADSEG